MLVLIFRVRGVAGRFGIWGRRVGRCWNGCRGGRRSWLGGAHAAASSIKVALCRGHRVGRVGRDHLCRKAWVAGEPVVADCIQECGDGWGSEASMGKLDVVGVKIVPLGKMCLARCGGGLRGQMDG